MKPWHESCGLLAFRGQEEEEEQANEAAPQEGEAAEEAGKLRWWMSKTKACQ